MIETTIAPEISAESAAFTAASLTPTTPMPEASPETPEERARRAPPVSRRRALLLPLVVILGDLLLWGAWPGLNLFVFAAVLAFGILIGAGPLSRRGLAGFGIAIAATLPLIEAPSFAGVLVALGGLAFLALWTNGLAPRHLTALPLAFWRYGLVSPFRLPIDVLEGLASGFGLKLGRDVLVSTMPVLLALIFAGLFWAANPIIATVVAQIGLASFSSLFDFWRVMFWLVLAACLWPLLRPTLLRWRERTAPVPALRVPENMLVSPAAILRSLIVFNALFAIETLLDLTYLWGGIALPSGLTYAEFAHRGAYPLILTALLAGAFVLATMRRDGPAAQSRPIRLLVYAWIGQNVLLCLSAILRLKLYVESYSLTELRIDAGIWMGLVAAGLLLILLRIWLNRSNEWLLAMNGAVLALTLYGCAATDFPSIIADFNVDHSPVMKGTGIALDLRYMASLGPSILPAIDRYAAAGGSTVLGQTDSEDANGSLYRHDLRTDIAHELLSTASDWRSWSFRDWRIGQYLAHHPGSTPAAGPGGLTDPNH